VVTFPSLCDIFFFVGIMFMNCPAQPILLTKKLIVPGFVLMNYEITYL